VGSRAWDVRPPSIRPRSSTIESGLDTRADSGTLALVNAHRAYAEVGSIDDERVDGLLSHVEGVVEALFHESDDVAGLVRYEGDGCASADQGREKIWTGVNRGAHAAARTLAALLADHATTSGPETWQRRPRDLLALVLPGGALCEPIGLPAREQVFDDGTPTATRPGGPPTRSGWRRWR